VKGRSHKNTANSAKSGGAEILSRFNVSYHLAEVKGKSPTGQRWRLRLNFSCDFGFTELFYAKQDIALLSTVHPGLLM
jgi:hypothetical protein